MLESADMADESGEAKMPSAEERLSFLEGKSEDYGRDIRELREMVRHMDEKMDRRFEVLEQKMDRRFDALDKRIDTRIWSVVGMQVALFLAVIGVLLR
jgi:hypothetical protein